jgi:hypothetical protein
MRTTHAWIACCSLLLLGAPVMLTHCSGGSSSTSPKGDGGGQGGSSSGVGASSGGSSSSSSSGGSGDDGGGSSSGTSSGGSSSGTSSGGEGGTSSSSGGEGGTTSSSGGVVTPVPEGGAPSDPNSVTCGATSCNTTTQYCCAEGDAGGGSCLPYNNGSCNIKVSCNEAADCAGGVCCTQLAFGTHTTSCMASCGAGNFQICRTDAECGSADAGAAQRKCIVQTCQATASMTGPKVTVEACAYFTPGPGGGWGPLPLCTAN